MLWYNLPETAGKSLMCLSYVPKLVNGDGKRKMKEINVMHIVSDVVSLVTNSYLR